MDKKFYKLLFGDVSYASGAPYKYKINELMEYENFNDDPSKNYGGMFISTEDVLARSLIRGTTLYEVAIPDDAKVIEVPSELIPHGRFKTNKLILSNPIQMTDDSVLELLTKTHVRNEVYADIVAIVSIYGFAKSARYIIANNLTLDNIDRAIAKVEEFLAMGDGFGYGYVGVNSLYLSEVLNLLKTFQKIY